MPKPFVCVFLIEHSCLNCFKVDRTQDYDFIFIFIFLYRKLLKQVGKLGRRLYLKLSKTQFTGLRRRRPPPEIAVRLRCLPLIKNLTAHSDS